MASFLRKKKIILFIALFVLFLAGCNSSTSSDGSGDTSGNANGNGGGSAGSEGEITLVVSNYYPSTSGPALEVFEPWKEYVETKTEGRVKVDLYHNGALGKSDTVLEDVTNGIYDVGLMVSLYYQDTEFFPITIADLPFASSGDLEVDSKVIQEFSAQYRDQIWANVKYMGIVTGPPSYFISTRPIRTLDDFKGLQIRASSDNDVVLYQELGATPTQVPMEELYNALSKNIIDVVLTGSLSARDTFLPEVAPYFLNIPVRAVQTIPVMNQDFFNSLPEDLQKLFEEDLNPEFVRLLLASSSQHDAVAIKDIAEQNKARGGLEDEDGILEFSEEDMRGLQLKAKPVWDNWVKLANEKGYPGEEMMEKFKDILDSHGIQLPF